MQTQKQMHKITQKSISDYESDVKKRTRKEKWKTQKLQKEYKKRSQTVKAQFKVLKQQKNLNTVKVSNQNNVETRTGYKTCRIQLKKTRKYYEKMMMKIEIKSWIWLKKLRKTILI